MKTVFLEALPITVQQILSTYPGSLDNLAEAANKIIKISPHSQVNAISSTLSEEKFNSKLGQLQIDISEVKSQLCRNRDHLSSSNCNAHPQFHSSSCPHSCRSEEDTKRRSFCWYHFKFGNEAKNCLEPCTFKKKNGNSN